MIEPRETEIGGKRYVFTPLSAKPAREMLGKLLKVFGPSFSNALEGIKGTAIDPDIVNEEDDAMAIMQLLGPLAGSLSGIVRGIYENLNPKLYDELLRTFLTRTYLEDGEKKYYLNEQYRDTEFATSLVTEGKILIWCLQEQYSDFFGSYGKVKSFIEEKAPQIMSHFISRPASTGGSNGLPRPQNIQAD